MPARLSFNPADPLADEILAQLADPALSLSEIAARHATTLEALTLWIARPEISQRLEQLHSLAASRTRLLAAGLTHKSIAALASVLDHCSTETAADAAAPPSNRRSPELRQRTLESSRRAATRIFQLTNFNPPRLFSDPALRVERVALAARPPVMLQHHRELHPDRPQPQPPAPSQSPKPHPTPTLPTPSPTPHLSRLRTPFKPTRPHNFSPSDLLQSVGIHSALLDLPLISNPNEHWP